MATQHAITSNRSHSSDIRNRPGIIRTNYGDESIALVQWLFESNIKTQFTSITVVYIETGWQAEQWNERVHLGELHARKSGFEIARIQAPISLPNAVHSRGSFPSEKFQWCTSLLKGLPFNDWLDTFDLRGEAVIMIAKRKAATLAHDTLKEWIESCEFHQGRTVWHPLINIETEERDALLSRAGFTPLGHRSLECQPCIHSSSKEIAQMSENDRHKLKLLEEKVGVPLSGTSAKQPHSEEDKDFLCKFYRGCGNHFGCGL